MKKLLSYMLLCLLGMCALVSPGSAGTAEDEPDFYFLPKLEAFRYDSRMIDAAEIATSSAYKSSRRRCWRAVKKALLEANLIDFRPTTKYAKQAGDELEQKFAFKKLEISDPFEAPIGAILVYGGNGAGHVEIRSAEGFVSDFVSERPSNRPLIGVYVRKVA